MGELAMPSRRLLPSLLILSLAGSGCLLSHSHKRVVRQDEIRERVEFESDEAAATFHAVATDDDARSALRGEASFGIPFVVGISHQSVLSPNAYYNDQVAMCDMNGDGFLSDEEIAIFMGSSQAE